MSEESGEDQSKGTIETGREKTEFHRPPRIREKDMKIYNTVEARIRKGREEEPNSSKTNVEGFTRAEDVEKFVRDIEEAKIHSIVSSEIDEAYRINTTRDRAIKFGLDPDRADDAVFQGDLEMAEDICNELGLNGRTVYQDAKKRSTLESLIATEILVRDAARIVTAAEAALTNAQNGLLVKKAALAQLQSEQVAGRNELIERAKPGSPNNSAILD
jgi:hypothetical protein